MNWPWKRKTIVLGAELAAARKAEETRLAAGVVSPSPLPDEDYDFERGDYDLVTVTPLQLDLELRSFTNEVRQTDIHHQGKLQQRLSLDNLYTLIHFVKRCSVLALNADSVDWCMAGLTAFAIIDETRIDWRDGRWAAGLLEYAILKSDGVKEALIELAADLPRLALEFLNEVSITHSLSQWGYAEINTVKGIGLISHGGAKYEPKADLTKMALQISEKLSDQRYVGHVETATNVPDAWFRKDERQDVRLRLRKARGAVLVRGSLRQSFGDAANQILFEWIVEMPNSDDCEYLCKAVGSGGPITGRYAVGLLENNLFALLVAGSVQEGVEPFENLETLAELGEQARQILKAGAAS